MNIGLETLFRWPLREKDTSEDKIYFLVYKCLNIKLTQINKLYVIAYSLEYIIIPVDCIFTHLHIIIHLNEVNSVV